MKRLVFAWIVLFAGCAGGGTDSPYAEILNAPPYDSITDSIKKEPNRDDLYFRRAVLLNRNNLPEPALADFRKAWSLQKEENYALGVSNVLIEKRPDSAALFLEEATREMPGSIFLQIMLARSYDAAGKTDNALAVCETILRSDSTQVNTLYLQSELLEKKNDMAGMIDALEKANRLVPENKEIAAKLMYQYAESKNPKALTLADEMIRKDSLKLNAGPLYVKGLYYSNINDAAKAISLFNATIQQDHNYLNAYIEKGKIQFNQRKIREALRTFQLANVVKPSFPDAWYWIGRCQEALGEKEEAKSNYEKAYGLDKTFIEAKEAADRL